MATDELESGLYGVQIWLPSTVHKKIQSSFMHSTALSTCCYVWMQFNSYHIFVGMQTNKNKKLES